MPSPQGSSVRSTPSIDPALIAQWQNGDDQAGEQLFGRHSGAIVGFFKRKARRDAEDLTHTTFMRMLEGRDRLRRAGAFRAYALGIARNVLREHVRELARARKMDAEVDSLVQLTPEPCTVTDEREQRRLLLEGLRHLAIDDQVLVELFYWEGLDSGAVGAVVGMPASSVRTRLCRARERLKQLMREAAASHAVPSSASDGLDRWVAEVQARVYSKPSLRTTAALSDDHLHFLGTLARVCTLDPL